MTGEAGAGAEAASRDFWKTTSADKKGSLISKPRPGGIGGRSIETSKGLDAVDELRVWFEDPLWFIRT
jgi:hypothetical protein